MAGTQFSPMFHELMDGRTDLVFELFQMGCPADAKDENGVALIRHCAYYGDVIVEQSVILELKSVERLLPVHEAQTLTYLRLSGCRIGLLMNFNSVMLKDGLRRFIP